ncbi:MAG: hypothetical protein K2X87_19530, partial [Gemmataceae bacterium]|nr:hypothetical protein [Gemmataceae bacterium]
RTNPALRAFDAYALEARFLDGRRLLASEVRRLPGPVRAAVLRAEAADAADEYRTNPALRAFDAARLEAGLLEVPA